MGMHVNCITNRGNEKDFLLKQNLCTKLDINTKPCEDNCNLFLSYDVSVARNIYKV